MNQNEVLLGKCIYNTQTHTIIRDGKEVVPGLTPTEASILEYLYTNEERSISREELLQIAAGSRVVGANIITQYIRSIRKALGDSARNPEYIRTYQKAGYRFIAPVNKKPVKSKQSIILLIFSVLVALIAIQIFFLSPKSNERYADLPRPITSLKGLELFGNTSPNGEYIVFSHKSSGKPHWNLVLKKRGEENYFQLTDDNVNDAHAKFSPSGNQLLYQHYNENVNQIMIAEINWQDKKLENIKAQIEIPPGLFTVYLTWKDENNFYYSGRQRNNQTTQIFSHNIETTLSKVITNPPNNGAGDLALAYSREANKLVFLRNIGFSKTDIYIYDPIRNDISKQYTLPLEPLSIDWTKDGSNLVFRTASNKLGLLSIEDGSITNILQSNSSVYAPFILDSNTVGFMRGDFIASDIVQITLSGDMNPTPLITSSYNDFSPEYAHFTGELAFVSNRSGANQVWLRSKNGALKQITNFSEPPLIWDLVMNKQGQFAAFTTNATIQLLDLRSGKVIFSLEGDDKAHNNPVFSNDGKDLIYTVKNNDKWQIEKRNLENMQLRTVLTEGYLARPCENDDCIYFRQTSSKNLYRLDNDGKITDTGIDFSGIGYVDQFEITDNTIYFVKNINDQKVLFSHDLVSNKMQKLSTVSSVHFSLNRNEKLIYTTIRNENDTNLESVSFQ